MPACFGGLALLLEPRTPFGAQVDQRLHAVALDGQVHVLGRRLARAVDGVGHHGAEVPPRVVAVDPDRPAHRQRHHRDDDAAEDPAAARAGARETHRGDSTARAGRHAASPGECPTLARMPATALPVLIAGGGIGGLTLAQALAAARHAVPPARAGARAPRARGGAVALAQRAARARAAGTGRSRARGGRTAHPGGGPNRARACAHAARPRRARTRTRGAHRRAPPRRAPARLAPGTPGRTSLRLGARVAARSRRTRRA